MRCLVVVLLLAGVAAASCPDGCSGHGTCVRHDLFLHKCECVQGWAGKACDSCAANYHGDYCCPGVDGACNLHGDCTAAAQDGTGLCSCSAAWAGAGCDECAAGFYGASCEACQCSEHGTCSDGLSGDGSCACEADWAGLLCDLPAALCPSAFGAVCSGNGFCYSPEGSTEVDAGLGCSCDASYLGDACQFCNPLNSAVLAASQVALLPSDAKQTDVTATVDGQAAAAFPLLQRTQAPLRAVSVGAGASCYVGQDDSAACWGENGGGQLGVASSDVASATLGNSQSISIDDIYQLSVGRAHVCAVTRQSGTLCWGSSASAALGVPTAAASVLPADAQTVQLPSNATALSVSAHACVVTDDGAVYCWGAGAHGQLGNGTAANSDSARLARLPGLAMGVAAGGQHSCALTVQGDVFCWGSNRFGQLGVDGDADLRAAGDSVPLGGAQAVQVTAGELHSCVLTTEGDVYCWGDNADGQLGSGAAANSTADGSASSYGYGDAPPLHARVPLPLAALTVSAGARHTCALLANRTVACWGSNVHGQVMPLRAGAAGLASFRAEQAQPVRITRLAGDAIDVSAGERQTCALLATGGLACWGEMSAAAVQHVLAGCSAPACPSDRQFDGSTCACVDEQHCDACPAATGGGSDGGGVCAGHGVCADGSSTATSCACEAEWIGDACDIRCLDCSASSTGSCTHVGGTPACECDAGWTAPHCSQSVADALATRAAALGFAAGDASSDITLSSQTVADAAAVSMLAAQLPGALAADGSLPLTGCSCAFNGNSTALTCSACTATQLAGAAAVSLTVSVSGYPSADSVPLVLAVSAALASGSNAGPLAAAAVRPSWMAAVSGDYSLATCAAQRNAAGWSAPCQLAAQYVWQAPAATSALTDLTAVLTGSATPSRIAVSLPWADGSPVAADLHYHALSSTGAAGSLTVRSIQLAGCWSTAGSTAGCRTLATSLTLQLAEVTLSGLATVDRVNGSFAMTVDGSTTTGSSSAQVPAWLGAFDILSGTLTGQLAVDGSMQLVDGSLAYDFVIQPANAAAVSGRATYRLPAGAAVPIFTRELAETTAVPQLLAALLGSDASQLSLSLPVQATSVVAGSQLIHNATGYYVVGRMQASGTVGEVSSMLGIDSLAGLLAVPASGGLSAVTMVLFPAGADGSGQAATLQVLPDVALADSKLTLDVAEDTVTLSTRLQAALPWAQPVDELLSATFPSPHPTVKLTVPLSNAALPALPSALALQQVSETMELVLALKISTLTRTVYAHVDATASVDGHALDCQLALQPTSSWSQPSIGVLFSDHGGVPLASWASLGSSGSAPAHAGGVTAVDGVELELAYTPAAWKSPMSGHKYQQGFSVYVEIDTTRSTGSSAAKLQQLAASTNRLASADRVSTDYKLTLHEFNLTHWDVLFVGPGRALSNAVALRSVSALATWGPSLSDDALTVGAELSIARNAQVKPLDFDMAVRIDDNGISFSGYSPTTLYNVLGITGLDVSKLGAVVGIGEQGLTVGGTAALKSFISGSMAVDLDIDDAAFYFYASVSLKSTTQLLTPWRKQLTTWEYDAARLFLDALNMLTVSVSAAPTTRTFYYGAPPDYSKHAFKQGFLINSKSPFAAVGHSVVHGIYHSLDYAWHHWLRRLEQQQQQQQQAVASRPRRPVMPDLRMQMTHLPVAPAVAHAAFMRSSLLSQNADTLLPAAVLNMTAEQLHAHQVNLSHTLPVLTNVTMPPFQLLAAARSGAQPGVNFHFLHRGRAVVHEAQLAALNGSYSVGQMMQSGMLDVRRSLAAACVVSAHCDGQHVCDHTMDAGPQCAPACAATAGHVQPYGCITCLTNAECTADQQCCSGACLAADKACPATAGSSGDGDGDGKQQPGFPALPVGVTAGAVAAVLAGVVLLKWRKTKRQQRMEKRRNVTQQDAVPATLAVDVEVVENPLVVVEEEE